MRAIDRVLRPGLGVEQWAGRRFFRRRRWDEERAREMESYLEMETDENVARGMRPEDARAAARRKLGKPLRIREEIYA